MGVVEKGVAKLYKNKQKRAVSVVPFGICSKCRLNTFKINNLNEVAQTSLLLVEFWEQTPQPPSPAEISEWFQLNGLHQEGAEK
ncbi:hypothetical protein IFM89_025056 [Coptis chinensis]|uniref:Uncharacterized protein n=1 Tax=Coptis chinensis TaxID=261450 RepID=A0A835I393_9MAGN|nr:hypothetical protein IFM89_025056 [Coptis chinensis]